MTRAEGFISVVEGVQMNDLRSLVETHLPESTLLLENMFESKEDDINIKITITSDYTLDDMMDGLSDIIENFSNENLIRYVEIDVSDNDSKETLQYYSETKD